MKCESESDINESCKKLLESDNIRIHHKPRHKGQLIKKHGVQAQNHKKLECGPMPNVMAALPNIP